MTDRAATKPAGLANESGLEHPAAPSAHGAAPDHPLGGRAARIAIADRKLMRRIFAECHAHILAALTDSEIPPELLGGLTANESGGNAGARRFEPGVFAHLKDVATGRAAQYGSIHAQEIEQAEQVIGAAKSPQYHALFLNPAFAADHAPLMSKLREDALRDLATSWGYTQVMGYHVMGGKGSVEELRAPGTHYRYAAELLHAFIRQFRLDARRDLESLFHCWNSGRPRGKTYDPAYVGNGLRRAAIYRELMGEREAGGTSSAAGEPLSPAPVVLGPESR